MNLKRKLNHHVTAIIKVIDDRTAILSDESSFNDDNPLHLITADKDVLNVALERAVACNADTRFDHKILVYDANDACTPYTRKKAAQNDPVAF